MDDNAFYSINKLVEFGMGIAVANQMADFVNQSIKQMDVPGAGKTMHSNASSVYFVVIDNKATGPFSAIELARLIAEKKVLRETYIWKPGMRQWDLAKNISEIFPLVALAPPPIPKDSK